jgi:transposase
LARAGRSISQLAREFEPTAETIRQWIKQAALDEGLRSDGLTTSEREELNRLRR